MEAPPKRRAWLQWVLGATGLLMGIAAASIAFRDRSPAPPPRPHSTAATALYVQHEGGALRLHWDPAVRANTGVILIQDGSRESRLDLNANELRAGVASYWPESKEVTFRLQLDGGDAGSIRATADTPSPKPSAFAEKPHAKPAVAKPVKLPRREPADDDDDPPVKRSRLSRVAGKIPLLRRLRKH